LSIPLYTTSRDVIGFPRSEQPVISGSTIVGSVTPGPRGTYAVYADIAAGNSYNATTSPETWQCNLAVQSQDGSQYSSAAPGYASTRGFTTIGITGKAYLSPNSKVVIICHNDNQAHPVYNADVNLTVTEEHSGFGPAGRPARRHGLTTHGRITNRFSKAVPPGSPAAPARTKGHS
jgi:hypothetical protein